MSGAENGNTATKSRGEENQIPYEDVLRAEYFDKVLLDELARVAVEKKVTYFPGSEIPGDQWHVVSNS